MSDPRTPAKEIVLTCDEWTALEMAIWGKDGNTLEVNHSQRIGRAVSRIAESRVAAERRRLRQQIAEMPRWEDETDGMTPRPSGDWVNYADILKLLGPEA